MNLTRTTAKLLMSLFMFVMVAVAVMILVPSEAHALDTTFYVDSVTGNDNNNGTSTSTPWKTLEKVSSMTFEPGDKILFKSGSQWTGSLKLHGSGVDGNPIIVDQYGSGPKPLIQPGPDWVVDSTNQAARWLYNVSVNNAVELINVNYWEINNLELHDPKFDSIDPHTTDVFRRGVYVGAMDFGKMTHIHLKNLYIHGFRGPASNDGKDAGGIIFNVNTDPDHPENRVMTWFDDILIENNTIENVGRSGINFITPWGTRQPSGDRWHNFPHPTVGGDWKGHTNVRITNNSISNTDGDGAILDTLDGAVFEYNRVNAAGSLGVYAAGVFPWKSDDIKIQFNELSHTKTNIDGQGVEIDALNQNVLVQYNYSHDNYGGFVGFCNYGEWVSYDGTFRYNISQNDDDAYSVMRLSSVGYNSQVYNNTVYMGPGVTRSFLNTGWVYDPGQVKVYNNIFHNEGTLVDTGWKESHIDWESNVYYGFPNTPSNDTTKLTSNPSLVNPGSGGNQLGYAAVDGYKLQSSSPAINSGIAIANNGGRDYFGTSLYVNAPDRGAHEFTGTVTPPETSIRNPGFETGNTSAWNNWGGSITNSNAHSGSYSGAVTNQASIEQVINVQPNTTYELKAWAKSGVSGSPVMIGVKNYGGAQQSQTTSSTGYTQLAVTFTTGASNTNATIFVYKPSGTGTSYADDFTIMESSGFDPNTAYTIINGKSGKVLDVHGNSTTDGANVIQWTDNGGTNQQWNIVDLGNGYYKIINVNSGKALDVEANSTADGGNLLQWTYSGGLNQQWRIEPVGDYFKFINRNSGKVLDVNAGSTADGANVIQWTDTGATNQQWTITQ